MAKKDKKKLCWNCEGSVSRSESNCTYCGVYLHPHEDSWDEGEEELVVDPPYQPLEEEPSQRDPLSQEMPALSQSEIRRVLVPLSLFMAGSLFLLFGLILFFFSHHGVLTLQWNASYWSLYFLLGLPFLWVGWHYLDLSGDSSPRNTSQASHNQEIARENEGSL